MNKRQIKIEMLFASDEILRQCFDRTTNKEHLEPLGEFIGIIGDAIDQSLVFYERDPNRAPELGTPKCKSLKVTFAEDHLSVKYLINFSEVFDIMMASPFEIMMGGIDFESFFKYLNKLSNDLFYTQFSIDEMDGTIECETRFELDHLLDYAKRMPQPHKLF